MPPILMRSLLVIAGLGIAYIAGSFVGDIIREVKTDEFIRKRDYTTEVILERLESIQLGERLSPSTLQTLDGGYLSLSDVINCTTLVVFFDTDCANCYVEIARLSESLSDRSDAKGVVILFIGNPLDMVQVRQSYDLTFTILYDEDAQYVRHLGITLYLFNLLVDRNARVLEVIPGVLQEQDLVRLKKVLG